MKIHSISGKTDALVQDVLKSRWTDTARILELCPEIIKEARQNGDAWLLGFAYYHSGSAHYIRNEIEATFRDLAKAIGYLEESGQWELIARAYNVMAISSAGKGNAAVAADYYLTGLEYCRKYEIRKVESSIYLNLGYLYLDNQIYDEAQNYFEKARADYDQTQEEKRGIATLTMLYTNLALCDMRSGKMEKTAEYISKLDQECQPHFENVDYVYVECMKAAYYHKTGDWNKRDQCIEDIRDRIGRKMALMDIFDDLYHFCLLLVEIDRMDILREICDKLEPVVESTKVAYLEKKMLSLKMKYYNKSGQEAAYLKTAVQFYEKTEIADKESKSMITNMLYVRSALEHANEKRINLEQINLELMEKAETDPLTGLMNRYRFTDYSEKIVESCYEKNIPLAFEILDIDYFKQYNDHYGHQAGDECIQKVASLIKKMQNDQIFCARYGGDEFIIIYSGLSAQQVYDKAKRFKDAVMELGITHGESQAADIVTVSQGICFDVPKYGNKSWDFLHAADMLLYRVKKKKRNEILIGDIYEEPRDEVEK